MLDLTLKRLLIAALSVLNLSALGAAPVQATAQIPAHGNAPPPRDLVTAAVDATKRSRLIEQHPAWAEARNDLGPLADDLPLQHLTLTLKRTAEREQAFQQLLQDQQNPASPKFHRWLTPVEVGEQFGASQHDVDAVSAWLSGQGLHVDGVANSRTRIVFSGTAGDVGAAFATSLHAFQVDGEARFSNVTDAQIPLALAPVVQSVTGLHTLKFRPTHTSSPLPNLSPTNPALSSCPNTGAACSYAVLPADFAVIYDLNPVYAQNLNGSGQTIVIVGKSRVSNADLTNFQTISGVTFATPTVIVPTALGGIDPGPPATTCTTTGTTDTCANPSDAVTNQSEATLDVQRAGSVAPGAALTLIVSADSKSGGTSKDGLIPALEYALDNNPPPGNILSISFASCESGNSSSTTQFFDSQFQQAAAEGISVFASSGDSGAAGCETPFKAPTSGQSASINLFCASGAVTCVGGTQFADTSNPSNYWSGSNGQNLVSALGYIPEGAWNQPLDNSGNASVAATGGGVSAYIATPSWQTGAGVPGTQGRYSPDVSFTASTHDPYLGCMAATGSSCTISNGSFTASGFGGTSASTPSMAGIAALLNQQQGAAQGNLNPRLYALAANTSNGVYHDVTVASSGVSGCDVSVPSLCNNTTPGPSGSSSVQGYLVGTGYDLATGLGSIDVAKLFANWNASTVPSFNLDQHGLTGSWYNPQTSGQGFLIEVYPDAIASGHGLLGAGWYTYDAAASGGQRWYTLQGDVFNTSGSAALKILTSTGGNFAALPAVAATHVGSATLTFSDCTSASLTYSFDDGRSGTIPLSRLDTNLTCSPSGDNGTAASNYLLSGAWYDAQTSGQGFFFDVSPVQTTFFAAWYTFVPNGASSGGGASQQWFTIQDNSYAVGTTAKNGLPIYVTKGGTFNAAGGLTQGKVGTVDISFSSCNAMTLTYAIGQNTFSVAPASGTIHLARVGPTPAGCSL
jgi:subtilase family serine protease